VSGKRYYPAFLDLAGRLVVIVGPAADLERKAARLARYGADVLVITPEPSEALLAAQANGDVGVEARAYVRGDLAGAALALCQSAAPEVQRAVFQEAVQVGCPVNIAGSVEHSSFIAPGVLHREPLQIAISTGGGAPQLAKALRRQLAEQFGAEWGAYTQLLTDVRAIALSGLADERSVDDLLESVIASDVFEQVRAGSSPTAQQVYERFAPTLGE